MLEAKAVRYGTNAVHIYGRFDAACVGTLSGMWSRSEQRRDRRDGRDGRSFQFALFHGFIRHGRAVRVSVVAEVADLPPQLFYLSEVIRLVHLMLLVGSGVIYDASEYRTKSDYQLGIQRLADESL